MHTGAVHIYSGIPFYVNVFAAIYGVCPCFGEENKKGRDGR